VPPRLSSGNYPDGRVVRRLSRWLIAALGVVLAGCATAPQINIPAESSEGSAMPVRILSRHGALSERQTQQLLRQITRDDAQADALQRHLIVEEAVANSPLVTGNSTQVLRDGPESFAAMFAVIRSAKTQIDLEYYIFEDVLQDGEQLSDLLVRERQQGVAVNVIYDSLGSISTPTAFFAKLAAAGVQLLEWNPINPFRSPMHHSLNQRDHRKLLVVDGATAIVGGVNLSKTYQKSMRAKSEAEHAGGTAIWRDLDLQIEGPAAEQLQNVFFEHWREQGGPITSPTEPPTSASTEGDEVIRIISSAARGLAANYYVTLLSAMRSAEHSIWLTAGYFVPTHQETESLLHAARRGVDVRILLPSQSDSGPALAVQRSHYTRLLGAGVHLYEVKADVLHSKTVVVDGAWSVIGSSNFDNRSAMFNDELDAVVLGVATGEKLHQIFEDGQGRAEEIDLSTWRRQRSLSERFREWFWRLWEDLL
jgi:cardiolipin synthase A/B